MALGCNKETTLVCLITCSFVTAIYGVWYMAKFQQGENGDHDVTRPQGFADPTLKFVAVIFRHGDRAPYFEYKTDPHKMAFPEGRGELTKKGKQHMYKKGQFFRRMYNGYTSDLYLDSEILMKTTNLTRTYMSAAMVLAGMYPPKSYQKWSDSETLWQPIPIYDSPDHGTIIGQKKKCPLFDKIFDNLVRTLDNAPKNETETLLQYLSEKCGQPIPSVTNLVPLYDVFLCQIADGLLPPKWAEPNILREIKSINENTFKYVFKNTELQNLVVGPLLQEIVSNMVLRSNTSNDNSARKMYLYAGHDITIGMTLGFMENYNSVSGFGGSLHFHLYLNKTDGYTIKMFFYDQWDNDKGEEVDMTKCGNPCTLKDFMNLVKNTITSNKWKEECQKVES